MIAQDRPPGYPAKPIRIIIGMIADAHGLQATFYGLAITIVLGNFLVMFVPAGGPPARDAVK